jgi:peptidoglycan/LPS O-acetylase OafA/YrhL
VRCVAGVERLDRRRIAQPRQSYLPQLDGVRALAIALVLAVHTNHQVTGGILGVDLFFVLSGYLITSLLLTELAGAGRIATSNFYARRALRLLPALLVTVVLVAVISRLPHALPTDLAFSIPIVLLYVTNWAATTSTPRLGGFAHLWSLAIEEQFYLVWPWVIRRWAHARHLAIVLVSGALVVMAARTSWALHNWRGANSITFLRADGLLLGAALAVVFTRERTGRLFSVLRQPWVAPLALVGVIVPVVVLVKHFTAPTISVAEGCESLAGVTLIASIVIAPASLVARVLCARPLVGIGKVSYAMYLFNFPIFALVQAQGWATGVTVAVEYAALAVLTFASWRFVERPALKSRRKYPPAIA